MSKATKVLNLIEEVKSDEELMASANKMVDEIEKKSDKTYSKDEREELVQKFLKNMKDKMKTEMKDDDMDDDEKKEKMKKEKMEKEKMEKEKMKKDKDKKDDKKDDKDMK